MLRCKSALLIAILSLAAFAGCQKAPVPTENAATQIVQNDWLNTTPGYRYPIDRLEKHIAAGDDVNRISEATIDPKLWSLHRLYEDDDTKMDMSPLLAAALRGDEPCFARLVQAGADPNLALHSQEDGGEWTPLRMAVWLHNVDAVRLLIGAGADVNHILNEMRPILLENAQNLRRTWDDDDTENLESHPDYQIALMLLKAADLTIPMNQSVMLEYAEIRGCAPLVRAFLDAGVDVNTKTSEDAYNPGRTALMLAAQNADVELVRLLLQRGADVNATDGENYTALSCCLSDYTTYTNPHKSDHVEIAKMLLKAGADIRIKPDISFDDPLDKAVAFDEPQLLDAMLEANREAVLQSECLLMNAARQNPDLAMHLVDVGFDTRSDEKCESYQNGISALLFAAQKGHLRLTEALIKGGADLEHRTRDELTPLIIAAKHGNTEIVQALLKAGANPNAKDYKNRTALMYATSNNHIDIEKTLIAAKVDVNAASFCGQTALCYAASDGYLESIQLLLQSGAKVDSVAVTEEMKESCRDPEMSALDYAVRERQIDAVNLLLSQKPKLNHAAINPLFFAKDSDMVQILVKAGVSLDPAEKHQGKTLLMHIAGLDGTAEILRKMLKTAKNVNAVDDDGKTAVQYALENDRFENAKLLIAAGAKSENILAVVAKHCDPDLMQHALKGYKKKNVQPDEDGYYPYDPNNDALYDVLHDLAIAKKNLLELETDDAQRRESLQKRYQNDAKCADMLRAHSFTLSDDRSLELLGMAIDTPDVLRELIAKGVNPRAEIGERIPLLFAALNKQPESMDILIENGYPIKDKSFLMLADTLIYGDAESMKILIDHGADIHQKAPRELLGDQLAGSTILMLMARMTPQPGLKALIPAIKGEDLDQKLRLILGANPDLNATDVEGNTPLMLAIETSKSTYPHDAEKTLDRYAFAPTPTIVALIQAGADPNIKNKEGKCPNDSMTPKGYEELRNASGIAWPANKNDE